MYNRIQIKKFSDEALKSIETHNLTALPDNYRLWFEYAAGTLDALVNSIDALVGRGESINEANSKLLYLQHLGTEDQRKTDASIRSVIEMLNSVASDVQGWGDGSDQTCKRLQHCCDRLGQDPSPAEIGEIIQEATGELQKTIESGKLATKAITHLRDEITILRQGIDQLSDQAITDALTGIPNRRGFDLSLEQAMIDANRTRSSFTLIMLDIDHFKSINDKFGHPTGDKVLRYVASMIRNTLRGDDFVARFGGEEFAIILPNTVLANGEAVAENIRKKLSARPLTRGGDKLSLGHITASFGLTRYILDEDSRNVIKRADENLYKAKQNGRNCFYSCNNAENPLPTNNKAFSNKIC
jgi:diguanylate cyclase